MVQKLCERWTSTNVPKAVLTSLHKQHPEFVLGGRRRFTFQRDPFNGLSTVVILNGNAGNEFAITPPQSPNRMLAVIEDLGVRMSA